MNIIDILDNQTRTAFSFEILPPIKGAGIQPLLDTVERLSEFDPKYINITTHRSEYVYRPQDNGSYLREKVYRRPGTIAVAAALQHRFNIPTVPHLLCSGFTQADTEQILLDLQFLGIDNLLVLRGDKAPDARNFKAEEGGLAHALELQDQVNLFNDGCFYNGENMPSAPKSTFHFGVACYPEKHEEAPNLDQDLYWLKKKVEHGASYAVTQLFYDNQKYFDFVEKAREAGITIPIIPGIKPLTKRGQLTALPKIFNIDIPQDLVQSVMACTDDKAVAQAGVEWSVQQCRELMEHEVPSIHFYSMGRADDVYNVAKEIY
ncbi:MAG TPA: methylenetetrahydrofolate reductase [NAD(P)H] [Bacteroidaceae bacterium]|nr:methylenetetrahydrofolate reductase [NAD(P)H] [Bacteroidaceae bacterium]